MVTIVLCILHYMKHSSTIFSKSCYSNTFSLYSSVLLTPATCHIPLDSATRDSSISDTPTPAESKSPVEWSKYYKKWYFFPFFSYNFSPSISSTRTTLVHTINNALSFSPLLESESVKQALGPDLSLRVSEFLKMSVLLSQIVLYLVLSWSNTTFQYNSTVLIHSAFIYFSTEDG